MHRTNASCVISSWSIRCSTTHAGTRRIGDRRDPRCGKQLHLDAAHGVRVRLTGPVPLEDEEFATLAQRAGLIASLASGAIIVMLWFVVRSPR